MYENQEACKVKLEQAFNPTRKSWSQLGVLYNVRTSFKQYRMIAALAAVIILTLNIVWSSHNEAIEASYIASLPATSVSYNTWQTENEGKGSISGICMEAKVSSCTFFVEHQDSSYNYWFIHGIVSYNDVIKRKTRSMHWTENRNDGDGLAIGCYVRVSSAHQADNGFSVDAQRAKLQKMIDNVNPSTIYWFVDAGMTGTKFDNRAVVEIIALKKRGKITELWVSDIDRIGRDAPKLIMFFFNFCEDGGKIRTPDAVYDNSRDLAAIMILTVKAFAAQDSNESRRKASMAGKAESFRRKRWNKRVPLGYVKVGDWIQRLEAWEQAINDIFASFIALKCEREIADESNKKYGQLLNAKLKHSNIRAILNDPVYVGRPEHLGVEVVDLSLAFVDEDTFRKCQEIIDCRKRELTAKPLDALQELLAIKHVWALHFIEEEIEFVHKACGGSVVQNGRIRYENIKQQLFLCNGCGDEWRVPSVPQLREEQERTGIVGKADLMDDARDLLREAVEKKKLDRIRKLQLKRQRELEQMDQPQSLPWWLEPVNGPDRQVTNP
jgi:DNA invertase Pin-like site-specific DNA recombinase